jgi:hypothetical protein
MNPVQSTSYRTSLKMRFNIIIQSMTTENLTNSPPLLVR